MRPPTLVVMAAGLGSRYGGIKQIDPVGPSGEILFDYSVYDAIRSGFGEVVFVIREEIDEAFRARVEPTIGRHCRVRYAYQRIDDVPDGCTVPDARRKPWGTAHAVLSAGAQLDGAFAVINADDFYGPTAFRTLHRFLAEMPEDRLPLEMALVGYTLSKTLTDHGHVSRGVCHVAPDGTLAEIREHKRIQRFGEAIRTADEEDGWHDIDPNAVVSINLWGLPYGILEEFGTRFGEFMCSPATDLETDEFFLPDVVGEIVRDGRGTAHVLPTTEEWVGVTYPDDRTRVERKIRALVADGTYPERLWTAD